MSRATVDLQSVRFFLGYGLIFIGQSALTILLAGGGDVRPAARPRRARAGAGAVRGADRRTATAAGRARRCRRSSSGSPSSPRRRRRTSPACAWSRRSPQEERQLERFRHSVARVFDQQMFATRIQARYNPMISFLPNLGLAAILLVGGREVIDGTLSIGDFTAFYAYLLMLISPMRTLGVHARRGAARRPPRARESSRSSTASRRSRPRRTRRRCPTGRGRVSCSRREPHLRRRTQPALRDVDLDVPGGRTVALVGATGSGKTTLVSLLPRLYDVDRGRGADRRRRRALGRPGQSLRRAIAVVDDDPFLFSATVHDNIAYARPDATREEVERPPARAQADGFIERAARGLRHAASASAA